MSASAVTLCSSPQIEGRENLPPSDKPVVYVANHQSFMVGVDAGGGGGGGCLDNTGTKQTDT